MDSLTLKGFGDADGVYEFDLSDLVNVGGPRALDLREQQRVKVISGYRGLEIRDAVNVLDPAMMVAFVDVILARHGKTVSSTRLWDARLLTSAEDETVDLAEHKRAILLHLGGVDETDQTMKEMPFGGSPEDGEEVEADPEA